MVTVGFIVTKSPVLCKTKNRFYDNDFEIISYLEFMAKNVVRNIQKLNFKIF